MLMVQIQDQLPRRSRRLEAATSTGELADRAHVMHSMTAGAPSPTAALIMCARFVGETTRDRPAEKNSRIIRCQAGSVTED